MKIQFYVQNISIYTNFGGYSGSTIHFLFIIQKKKTEKVQEHDIYLNQMLYHFN